MPDESHNEDLESQLPDGTFLPPHEDDSILVEARDALNTQVDSDCFKQFKTKLPKRIGRYRIISVLGQGGMGTVFEAEQEHPRRAVALKVVRAGRYVDEHYVRLFQREAQTLARLKHPGIATIYEAGCTEDGQHFFAMELVRGVMLNRYVELKNLRLRPRLRLFRRICDAINYAHQRGVIHRDLKPSNILIDEEGRPKILDFGLARITEADIAAATVVTEVGKIQGTLAYMSPEQARGNPDEIDVRSDVYTLGVILFEMLTGALPYDVEHSVLHESVRTICENDPRRPSAVDGSLRGDVETIILKALTKEPARRYQNAAALSEDIERFLTNQPILAHRPGAVYQLRKLVARHKAAFSFVAVLFVLISSFGVWMGILNRRLSKAERDASAKAETAEEVTKFLIDVFDMSDPNIATRKRPTLSDFLEQGRERVASKLKGQPKVQAALMNTLGLVYRNLALFEEATPLLENALKIRQGIYGDADDPELADSLHNYGWQLRHIASYEKAEEYVEKALSMRRRLLANGHNGASKAAVAESLLILGTVHRYQGEFEQAKDYVVGALEMQKELLSESEDEEKRQEIEKEIARCLETLAEVLEDKGEYDEALRHAEQALRIRSEMTDLGRDHPFTASTETVLALLHRDQGDYRKAVMHAERARDIYLNREFEERHLHVIEIESALGSFLRDQNELPAAEVYLSRAYENCSHHAPKGHSHRPFTAVNLAWLRLDQGRDKDAELLFREACDFYETEFGHANLKFAEPIRGLAQILLARGDARGAEDLLTTKALPIYDKYVGPNHWSIAITKSLLLACWTAQRKFQEAETLIPESYDILKSIRGESDRYVKEARDRIHDLYVAWEKPEKAKAFNSLPPEPVDRGQPAP